MKIIIKILIVVTDYQLILIKQCIKKCLTQYSIFRIPCCFIFCFLRRSSLYIPPGLSVFTHEFTIFVIAANLLTAV